MFQNSILESLFHVIFETTGMTFLVIFIFNIIKNNFKTTTKVASPVAGATLGVTPGCAGAISSSVMYNEGQAKFGFLIATLIATMGDGAFVLIVQDPKSFVVISIISFIVAVIFGFGINYLDIQIPQDKKISKKSLPTKIKYKKSHIFNIYNNLVWKFFILTIPFIAFMALGHTFHFVPHKWAHSFWFETIVLTTAVLMMLNAIVINKLKTCKDSCAISCEIEHKQWFVFKKTFDQLSHVMTIIILALIPTKLISANVPLAGVFTKNFNIFVTIIIAAAVAALPGSVPQILVLSLYLNGTMPFEALLAASISSSGDATFILFGKHKKTLMTATIINFVIAVIIASLYYVVMVK